MRGNLDFAVIALACHLLLGTAAFLTNPRRSINRSFLVLTLVLAGWIAGIQVAFHSGDTSVAAFALRLSSACGAMMPTVFALLRSSIIHYEETWIRQPWRIRWWVLASVVGVVFCFTPLYLTRVNILPVVGAHGAMQPVFHPLVWLYYVFLSALTLGIVGLMFRDQYRPPVSGVHRVELQFVWLACVTIVLSVALGIVLQSLLGAPIVRFTAAVRVILFDVIIA